MQKKGTGIIRKGIMYLSALVLVAGYPLAAMADTQEPVTEEVQTVDSATPTPQAPPKPTYSYNPETGTWDSEKWQFNPQTGAYEKPPAPIIVEPTDTPQQSEDKKVDTAVEVQNTIASSATSGTAAVSGNTTGGSATSGDATTVANLLTIANSTVTTGNNQKVATFTQDIMGDVKGDIVLYPLLLKAILEAKARPESAASVSATTQFDVNNKLDLAAQSGDALVAGNTKAGDATSGSATAVANVVTILNSMIATQDSFMGTINIYGNLEGDILIAPDFIPQMIANNSPSDADGPTKISTQDTSTIINNISAVAESGAANVFGNGEAGNATSGDARSNVVIFNVSGHEVVAKNSLLVFVNVLGKWVGMIVDAPANATAAMIGNGVTTNATYSPDLTVNSDTSHGITNTIAVAAQSGDATVTHNTAAGNATSGQARALANVANVSGSQIGATDWFGVLFFNVFQNWYGSFGVDTAYGNEATETPQPSGPVQFIPSEVQVESKTNSTHSFTLIDSRNVNSSKKPLVVETAGAVLASSTKQVGEVARPVHKGTTPSDTYDYRLWIIAGSLFIVGASAIGIRRLLQG